MALDRPSGPEHELRERPVRQQPLRESPPEEAPTAPGRSQVAVRLYLGAPVFEKTAERHARRASRFACAASQARVQMFREKGIHRDSSLRNIIHHEDAA